MKQSLNFMDFQPQGCTVLQHEEGSLVIDCQREGGRLLLEGVPQRLGGVDWTEAKYIVFDAVNHEQWVLGLTLEFWERDNDSDKANMHITMGLLPGVRTRLSLPLQALDSQTMFLPRTPGKLKTVVFGNKVDIREINRFAMGVMKCFATQKVEIMDLHLADTEPDYPLPDVKLVDELGQYSQKDWPGKTTGADVLRTYLQSEAEKGEGQDFFEDWSIYGGWKNLRFDATGFFRTHHDGQRWWLVDPEGYAFFSTGLDCTLPGVSGRVDGIEGLHTWLPEKSGEFEEAWSSTSSRSGSYFDFGIANLIRGYGKEWESQWARVTRRRLLEWGFNTIGNWSSKRFTQTARLPYVWPLQGFPETAKSIFRDFPDVYSDEYVRNAEAFARQLTAFSEDPFLIGYFLRNEPQWAFVEGLNIAEELLENSEDFASKDVLIKFLSERYGDISALNRAWNINLASFEDLKRPIRKAAALSEDSEQDLDAFSRRMIERYVSIPSKAAKVVDPYHLNLGMRYAYITNDRLLSGCENFDVFSINCYKMNPYFEAHSVGEMTKLPVMIGEFHFGALDRGLISNSLRGVTDQTERGRAYRYYLENAAKSPYCVGAHYFTLNDQAFLGRFDGENFQIGVVDICQRPYTEFVEGIKSTHQGIYAVAAGNRAASEIPPAEVERNGF